MNIYVIFIKFSILDTAGAQEAVPPPLDHPDPPYHHAKFQKGIKAMHNRAFFWPFRIQLVVELILSSISAKVFEIYSPCIISSISIYCIMY